MAGIVKTPTQHQLNISWIGHEIALKKPPPLKLNLPTEQIFPCLRECTLSKCFQLFKQIFYSFKKPQLGCFGQPCSKGRSMHKPCAGHTRVAERWYPGI